MYERHFKVGTLADLWGLSEDTIHRWLEDEEVLRVRHGKKDTPRVPESVAARVYAKHVGKRL